jgi:branched-chain amino acid transport system substrate-binding protein
MLHISRAGRILAFAVALAALVGAGSPAAALAATPRIIGTTIVAYPVQNHLTQVDAKVLDRRGKAVRNVKVTFAWKIDGHVSKTTARTNAKGVARGQRNVGSATPWRLDSVALSAVVSGKTAKGSARFQPLPAIAPGHPVAVRIGIAGPITAGATVLGQGMERGARLAIAEYNASSTVAALGLTFMGMTADDEGDPREAVHQANLLTADPRLLGVEGHLNSGCSIPASKVYALAVVPMITPASTNPALTQQGLNNVFRTCSTDAWQGPKGGQIAYDLGYRRVYVADDSTPYGEGLSQGFAAGFEAAGGTVVGTAKTSDRDTDFYALVTKIKTTSPDLIYYGGIYNAGALFAKQAKEGGLSAPFMGGDGLFDQHFITYEGASSANGDLATSVGYDADHLPNGTGFVSAFHARYPAVEIGPFDAYAYDATNVILSAIVAEAQTRGTAVIGLSKYKAETLARIRATNASCVTGPITFDSHGDRNQHDIAWYKVVGGAWVYQGIR